ncbi:MAG TPA: hypothetical protein VGO67_07210 [Verrucomicrobiae bacterium]
MKESLYRAGVFSVLFALATSLVVAQSSLPTTVTVNISGDGYVTPNLFGQTLKKGKKYSLKATGEGEETFSNWSGDITSALNPLSFVFESNMVLQANFVTNPFLWWQGQYNGLFNVAGGVTEQTSGMLKGVTISQSGTYSGKLLINGGSHSISGRFNLAGQATNRIARTAIQGGPITVQMTLQTPDESILYDIGQPLREELTGTVSGTVGGFSWSANLKAYQTSFIFGQYSSKPGTFTMIIPPDDGNNPPDLSPGGYGYASISSGHSIIGTLADGTSFSGSFPVSPDGFAPIYASIYGNKGLLFGWVDVADTNANVGLLWTQPVWDDAGLTWIHPKSLTGLYRHGFTNFYSGSQLMLSPNSAYFYSPPPANFGQMTNLLIFGENSQATVSIPVSTSVPFEVVGASVSGNANPQGLLKLTIGKGAAKVTAHGVLNYGTVVTNVFQLYGYPAVGYFGYFLTKTNSQAFILGP